MNLLALVTCFVISLNGFGFGFCKHELTKRETHDTTYNTNPQTKDKTTINIMLHFDHLLTSKLISEYRLKNRKKLKTVSRNIVKDVEKLFADRSLKQKIVFNVLDIKFLKNNTKVSLDENGSKYLKSYCDWQALRKMNKKKLYFSVLMTALDLYYIDGGGRKVWGSTGRGYMGGICNINKSCSIIEWHKTNAPYLLTHEIAHSLGLQHDGLPRNKCKSRGYMMSSKYNRLRHPRSWSPCNRMDLKKFLKSEKAWCLSNNEITDNETMN